MVEESPDRSNFTAAINDAAQDDDLQDENLDLFLSFVESRLRVDFTSTDLTRLIVSQGVSSRGTTVTSALPSGDASSPSKFLRLICKVFHRAAKPVKLRILMSVLGLDSDKMIDTETQSMYGQQYEAEKRKTDAIVWRLLGLAEQDDEKWVRVVGGILKGIMFKSSESGTEIEDVNYYADPKCRGQTAQRELLKVSENILNAVKEAHVYGTEEELPKAESPASALNASETNQSTQKIDSLLRCKDACPTFIPYRYSLLPPETIKTILPEVDANNHFVANMNASVFKIDTEVEERRAEEEGKELQSQKHRSGNVNDSTGEGVAVGGTISNDGRASNAQLMPGRVRGRFANTAGRGEDKGSSLFLRSSGGRGVAAGRMGGAGRMTCRSDSLGRLAGRLGTAGRLDGAAGRESGARAAGRGRAAALVGQTPVHRRTPGSTRAMLNSSTRGSSRGDSSKMKIIDDAEVEGLTRAQNEKEKLAGMSKAERRKKLLEDAAASGLRTKKARTDHSVAPTNSLEVGANEIKNSNVPSPQNSIATKPNELSSLLEKSNKLSDEDRQHIHEFFRDKSSTNPHPIGDASNDLWKVKLNEERTIDPTSGENVKETLYLEFDYKTRQYKKTKKIKRK